MVETLDIVHSIETPRYVESPGVHRQRRSLMCPRCAKVIYPRKKKPPNPQFTSRNHASGIYSVRACLPLRQRKITNPKTFHQPGAAIRTSAFTYSSVILTLPAPLSFHKCHNTSRIFLVIGLTPFCAGLR